MKESLKLKYKNSGLLAEKMRISTKNIATLALERGYHVGDVIELDGRKYIIEISIFGKGRPHLRELVPPPKKNTDLEIKTEQYLTELGFKEHIDYEKQHNVSKYWIDFAFVKEKVAIEPGADYWHNMKRDEEKEETLKAIGWKFLWFNEDAIKQNGEKVKEIIMETIMRLREERRRDFGY